MLFSNEYEKNQDSHQKSIVSVDNENKNSKHILKNNSNSEVYQYQLDGGIITQSTPGLPKCDYIIEVSSSTNSVFLIELKGKDIAHAFDQLTGTVQLFCNPDLNQEFQTAIQNSLYDYTVHLRIVSSKADNYRKIPQTHERKLLEQMKVLKKRFRIMFDANESIVRQAGKQVQITDTV